MAPAAVTTRLRSASPGGTAGDSASPDRASRDCGEACGGRYRLAPGCQVREERFGLLFYDLAGPRLLFAATGALLPSAELRRGGSLDGVLRACGAGERRRLLRLLDLLVKKGFLHEQPVR